MSAYVQTTDICLCGRTRSIWKTFYQRMVARSDVRSTSLNESVQRQAGLQTRVQFARVHAVTWYKRRRIEGWTIYGLTGTSTSHVIVLHDGMCTDSTEADMLS